MEELDIIGPSSLTMNMIRCSEEKLKKIKLRGSLRRRGSTPKRIA